MHKSCCSGNGSITFDGDVDAALQHYLSHGATDGVAEHKIFETDKNTANEQVELQSIGVRSKGKEYGDPMRVDEEIEIQIRFMKKVPENTIHTTLQVKDESGNYIFSLSSASTVADQEAKATGAKTFTVTIPSNFFNSTSFYVNLLFVQDGKTIALRVEDVLKFDILPKQAKLGEFMGKGKVPIIPQFPWQTDTKN